MPRHEFMRRGLEEELQRVERPFHISRPKHDQESGRAYREVYVNAHERPEYLELSIGLFGAAPDARAKQAIWKIRHRTKNGDVTTYDLEGENGESLRVDAAVRGGKICYFTESGMDVSQLVHPLTLRRVYDDALGDGRVSFQDLQSWYNHPNDVLRAIEKA